MLLEPVQPKMHRKLMHQLNARPIVQHMGSIVHLIFYQNTAAGIRSCMPNFICHNQGYWHQPDGHDITVGTGL